MVPRASQPEGVRVLPDGVWHVGEFAIVHEPSLRYLKARLVFEEQGAFLVDGSERLPVVVDGPAFEVTALEIDRERGEARVRLDDGSSERLLADSLSADERTGRVECLVRGGQARAVFTRAAHQTFLAHVEQDEDGRFYLRTGLRLLPVRT
jgi:hypothetical protein